MSDNSPILEVQNLKKYFPVSNGLLHAVDDVSFSIQRGETLGVVGESGCGKSTLGRTILNLMPCTSGKVIFDGRDITNASGKDTRWLRENMQMIFQDPYSSLNPRETVGEAIAYPLKLIKRMRGAEIEKEVLRLMDVAGIAKRFYNAYPHELDGGRRQRVGIARALSVSPKFVVCDEPVSALDVSVQAQVLNLMQDLQEALGLTYIFITHDMSVVKYISNNICVMYLGQVIEKASSDELFKKPMHPYTKALLEAVPSLDITKTTEQELLQGELTSPINPRPGCRFAARCKSASVECTKEQELREVMPGHFVACHRCTEQ